jgi:hypothetical protein
VFKVAGGVQKSVPHFLGFKELLPGFVTAADTVHSSLVDGAPCLQCAKDDLGALLLAVGSYAPAIAHLGQLFDVLAADNITQVVSSLTGALEDAQGLAEDAQATTSLLLNTTGGLQQVRELATGAAMSMQPITASIGACGV